jgi:hypothetical protein
MYCLQHHDYIFHLALGNNAENIAVEMNNTTLPFGLGIQLRYRFHQSETGITGYKLHSNNTTFLQVRKKTCQAWLNFFCSLGNTQYLAITFSDTPI